MKSKKLDHSKQPRSTDQAPVSFSMSDVSKSQGQAQPPSLMRKFSLSFHDAAEERDYEKYFYERNIYRWRNGLTAVLVACSALYLYSMAKTPADVARLAEFRSTRQFPATELAQHCPLGYFCSTCLPSGCTESYDVWKDLLFYLAFVLIPGSAALYASRRFPASQFSRWLHAISSAVVVIGAVFGLAVRFFVMEPSAQVLVSCMIQTGFIFAYFISMRIRFVYATVACTVIVVSFIVINGIQIAINFNSNLSVSDNFFPLFLFAALLIASTIVIAITSYELEVFQRMQFRSQRNMERANQRLNHQLKSIQKTAQLSHKEFDSPLERSIDLVRSCMAETALSPHVTMKLGHILTLLTSSNLLTPDFEKDLSERGVRMDNEQEAWLFSEIARRRGEIRGRGSSTRRRGSNVVAVASITGSMGSSQIPQHPPSTPEPVPSRRQSLPVPGTPEIGGVSRSITSSLDTSSTQEGRSQPDLGPATLEHYAMLLPDYNFPVFEYADATTNQPLSCMLFQLFKRHNLFAAFAIPGNRFWSFAVTIENGYHSDLPYHNRLHAADVLHSISVFTQLPEISKVLGDVELMAIFVAAAIHDYDHPGFNNLFLINTQDPRSILYNDRAVLENHHLASSFNILRRPECNFLEGLPKSDFKNFREIVIEMVLATDLAQHLPIISLFKNRATQGTLDPETNREDRVTLFKMMMKCADVGNPTKHWSLYEKWYKLIIAEFFRQGDTERKMGLDVSPFMDREKVNLASSQLGFIDYVVSPLFTAFNSYTAVQPILATLATNREIWAEKAKAQTVAAASAVAGPMVLVNWVQDVGRTLLVLSPGFVVSLGGLVFSAIKYKERRTLFYLLVLLQWIAFVAGDIGVWVGLLLVRNKQNYLDYVTLFMFLMTQIGVMLYSCLSLYKLQVFACLYPSWPRWIPRALMVATVVLFTGFLCFRIVDEVVLRRSTARILKSIPFVWGLVLDATLSVILIYSLSRLDRDFSGIRVRFDSFQRSSAPEVHIEAPNSVDLAYYHTWRAARRDLTPLRSTAATEPASAAVDAKRPQSMLLAPLWHASRSWNSWSSHKSRRIALSQGIALLLALVLAIAYLSARGNLVVSDLAAVYTRIYAALGLDFLVSTVALVVHRPAPNVSSMLEEYHVPAHRSGSSIPMAALSSSRILPAPASPGNGFTVPAPPRAHHK
ncbi:hypothetical protein H9P43_001046 [Blastocladiella emersonii ATCC 22665]|nr:hypothetical protein H9P43_001046 [Blastocladiella emersonii ATCC 22665]